MVRRRYRVFAWSVPVVVLNWLLISFVMLNSTTSSLPETIARGALAGTLFGLTTVAAAWTAFGPLPFVWRLPLSLLLVLAQPSAIAINGSLYGAPRGEFVLVALMLLCQWLLSLFLLWGVAIGFGVHLVHAEDRGHYPSRTQFGIRQVMTVTAIVALLFGIGRVLIAYTFEQIEHLAKYLDDHGSAIAFVVLSEVVLTLPLVVAGLSRRYVPAGFAISLAIFGLATTCEIPLMRVVGAGKGPDLASHVIGVNLGTLGVILILLLIVRLNGYSLIISRAQRPAVTG